MTTRRDVAGGERIQRCASMALGKGKGGETRGRFKIENIFPEGRA